MDKQDKQRLEKFWNKAHEKQLEAAISQNAELAKVFIQYPERKDLYKLKILDSEVLEAPTPPKEIDCETCSFQLPPISVGGKMTSRGKWGKCKLLNEKPHEVLYDGAKCEFYEKEK